MSIRKEIKTIKQENYWNQSNWWHKSTIQKYQNKYNGLKRITKIKYYHEKCNAYNSNIRKLWKLINEITGNNNYKTGCIESIKVNSLEHYMLKDISIYLGDYFANVGKQYAQKIVPCSTHINEYL